MTYPAIGALRTQATATLRGREGSERPDGSRQGTYACNCEDEVADHRRKSQRARWALLSTPQCETEKAESEDDPKRTGPEYANEVIHKVAKYCA
jgi:hypothetical protein